MTLKLVTRCPTVIYSLVVHELFCKIEGRRTAWGCQEGKGKRGEDEGEGKSVEKTEGTWKRTLTWGQETCWEQWFLANTPACHVKKCSRSLRHKGILPHLLVKRMFLVWRCENFNSFSKGKGFFGKISWGIFLWLIKNWMVSLQWLGLLLWQRFSSRPGNFHILQTWPKKKKKEKSLDNTLKQKVKL